MKIIVGEANFDADAAAAERLLEQMLRLPLFPHLATASATTPTRAPGSPPSSADPHER